MQPERIKGESQNNLGTYTVSSDVWSLGLSMIEIGLGQYPYPPETYSNVFAQLTAIVNGDPPELPEDQYSQVARDWVGMCLRKDPNRRASYRELLVGSVSFSPLLYRWIFFEVLTDSFLNNLFSFSSFDLSGSSFLEI